MRDPDCPRNTNQIQIFQSLAPPITLTQRMWERNGIVDSDSKVYGFLFLLTFLIKDCNQPPDVNETCFHVLKIVLRACVYIKGITFRDQNLFGIGEFSVVLDSSLGLYGLSM